MRSSKELVATTTSVGSGPDISNSDIAESNTRSRVIGLNTVEQMSAGVRHMDDQKHIQSRVAFSSIAGTSIAAVQPVHELTGVIPDGHGEHHTTSECLAHLCKAAMLLEG